MKNTDYAQRMRKLQVACTIKRAYEGSEKHYQRTSRND